ncbi:hypothetical protein LG307_02730 [Sutcliffiella horikoshii]|uniref:hypothetical protein n=1 Tax=Sutcliffiella horikoshii TaxID=79883 RepID=UPI0007BED2DC
MKNIFTIVLAFTLIFSIIVPNFATVFAEPNNEILLENEDDFLYDIGYEDTNIDENYGENQSDYSVVDSSNNLRPMVAPMVAPIIGLVVRTIVVNGVKISKNLYKSIKYAPKYPSGFKAVQNGTKNVTVNNKSLLNELREIEAGTWKKVYKDGYDKDGKKVSIHYFQSKSGLVFDVKVKNGWSVK